MKKIIFLLLLNVFFCVIYSDLIFKDRKYTFSVPEDFFQDQLEKNREIYRKSGLSDLSFRRKDDKLIIVGNYNIFPFRIYFSVLRKSLDIYIIRIDDFLFFNMVRYSKRKLVSRIVNSLSGYSQISDYFKLESDNNNIVIKLKKDLSKIFPSEYIVNVEN